MAALEAPAVPLVVALTILCALAAAVVIFRFISIDIRARKVKLHDWFCVLSLVFLFAFAITYFVGAVYGNFGSHADRVSQSHQTIAKKTILAGQILSTTSGGAFRIAILLLYMDVFSAKVFRCSAMGLVGLVSAFWLASFIASLAFCQPVNFDWNKNIRGGHCGDFIANLTAGPIVTMILDVFVVALPSPLLCKYQMSLQRKVGISVISGLGLGITAINIVRIIKGLRCRKHDFTYCQRDIAILACAELAFGIAIACVPTLGPVLPPHHFTQPAQVSKQAASNPWVYTAHGKHNSRRETYLPGAFQRIDEEMEMHYFDSWPGKKTASSVGFADLSRSLGSSPSVNTENGIQVRRDIEVVEGRRSRPSTTP